MESQSLPDKGPSRGDWRTLANGITAIRLFLVPLSAWLIVDELHFPALICFGVAVATDLVDGRVARLRSEVSPLGGFFDHATDALFVAVGLGSLGFLGQLPILLSPLILLAFIQYSLDSRILRGRFLRASQLGRRNGIAYYVLLGAILLRNAFDLEQQSSGAAQFVGWLLVVSTLVSMVDRGVAWSVSRKARDSPDAER